MIIETEDYKIDCTDKRKAVISGVLRLQSPISYNEAFKNIKKHMEDSPDSYTIDISELIFLNSAGITSFARLILLARNKDITINFIGKQDIPWQQKSIVSLKKLWEKLNIELT
ncbi:MAG: hypothetical protein GY730_02810 [bacterium]|nr:hypothetical protein [bacterium]